MTASLFFRISRIRVNYRRGDRPAGFWHTVWSAILEHATEDFRQ